VTSTLDLYGYKINDTNNIIESFINDQILFGSKKIEIITGDSKVIKATVKKIVKNLGVDLEEHTYNKQVLVITL
jgi:DNA-nicking Smr family endonuclease